MTIPHIAITMIPGRDDETKQALALKTQAFLVGELGIDPKFVSVSIQDIPKEEWAMSALTAHYETLARYMQWQDSGQVLAVGCGARPGIEHSRFPQEAYQLGLSLK